MSESWLFKTSEPGSVPEILIVMGQQLFAKGRRAPQRQPVHALKQVSADFTAVELNHVRLVVDRVPPTEYEWADEVRPNLPWAEEHFRERVSGQPLNPPPSHERWPFAVAGNSQHVDGEGKFSHTYPERFWPKHAGGPFQDDPLQGLRYEFGDLEDVVELLRGNLHTRQAYLPVWFPEDAQAAKLRQRVPCTLGYHFMTTDSGLDMEYHIRSCDFVRFLADDLYMAGRLLQWVCLRLTADDGSLPKPGQLVMNIANLHCFEGDFRGPLESVIDRWGEAVERNRERQIQDEDLWGVGYV